MPIYEFECHNQKCEKCHLIDEKRLKMEERDIPQFCECGAELIRLTSIPSPAQFNCEHTPKFHK